ncbi:transglycosylase SLT domain-containing protein [Caldimonas sp. KR1-144]|uniref:lytic transglycosylase domain-containing protein n=1 Tax=Caldimonas sp. KR1-144 TaxID=3400911 RepID=UPI003BFD3C13
MNRSTPRRARLTGLAASLAIGLGVGLTLGTVAPETKAQNSTAAPPGSESVIDARDALRRRDRARLASAKAATANHPLAPWVDYWELGNRLSEASQSDLDAFYARWPASYVEDRLRNDWLLELGKRRDWANLRVEFPRFRMNDDREVTCYWLLARHLDGEDVARDAREAWQAQREADDGCALLATTLREAGKLSDAEVWRKARLATENNRRAAARQVAQLIDDDASAAVNELFDNPQRYLARKANTRGRKAQELTALALIRLAANDPPAAAEALQQRWQDGLAPATRTWVWASIGKQTAIKLDTEASQHFQRAALAARDDTVELPDETLAWSVRAALRANNGAGRWQQVVQAINAMSANEQRDPTWVYWKARALQALAADSQDGAAMLEESRTLMRQIASPLHFYGKLALESLGEPLVLPPRPAPLTEAERSAAAANPGLQRALLLIAIGLRSEGVREWNFTLRGMDDRQLLAAAQLACQREVWDRCINTSERTKDEVDVAQRFPMPFRDEVLASARSTGIDPAYVYGLIRQESRFILDARSGVGASGLMQVMPATARWTAKKLGISYSQDRITERDTNLRIGTGYLKLVLDSFEGSQALAAAAYNAGPNRPRRWREGPVVDAAAWAENIPFNETRDYVKKVLSNATDYAALISGQPQSLRARLGQRIGPSDTPLPAADKELP